MTDIAGTTRDVPHERSDLNGLPITLTDTALVYVRRAILWTGRDSSCNQGNRTSRILLLLVDLNQGDEPLQLAYEYFRAS